ncbi:MAG: hypothetical protein M1817_003981 [Caeruleum heppii]|nr:MAG: hypothetical protein M1817_003981 [Caeruleum heppii]
MHTSSLMTRFTAALLFGAAGSIAAALPQSCNRLAPRELPPTDLCPPATGPFAREDSSYRDSPTDSPTQIYIPAVRELTDLLNDGLNEVGFRTPVIDFKGGPDFFALFTARFDPSQPRPQTPLAPDTILTFYRQAIIKTCPIATDLTWFRPTAPGQWQSADPAAGVPLQFGFQTAASMDQLACTVPSCRDAVPMGTLVRTFSGGSSTETVS